jgi:hypothetical protein
VLFMKWSILMFVFLSWCASAQQLALDRNEHHCGTIRELTKVQTTFTATNVGRAELIIEKIQPACGCTAGELGQDVLQSGGSTTITITFDPKGKPGGMRKLVRILSNDRHGGTHRPLYIAADALALLACEPDELVFTYTDGVPDSLPQAFELRNNGDAIAQFQGGGATIPAFHLTGPEQSVIEPSPAARFTVTVADNYQPRTTTHGNVVVTTVYGDTKAQARLKVRVNVEASDRDE